MEKLTSIKSRKPQKLPPPKELIGKWKCGSQKGGEKKRIMNRNRVIDNKMEN